MNKVLSVIIPSYNAEKYISETLPSFLCDEIIEDIQILIVNDGSKDNTSTLAHSFEKEHPNTIEVIDKENGGHGSTINAGLKKAIGKYIKVVDVDDWVDSTEFIKLVSYLRTADADLILSPFNRVNVDTNFIEKKAEYDLVPYQVYDFENVYPYVKKEYAMHSTTIKREAFIGTRQIDEHCFYVDQEYIFYPIFNIDTVAYAPYTVYQYRVGTNEQSMNMKNMQKNREMHKRVINSLISFYHEHERDDILKTKFIKEKIGLLCNTQITIYLSMKPSAQVKNELKAFLQMIKNETDVYNQINSKAGIILRKCGYMIYYPLVMIKKITDSMRNKE